MLTEIINKIFKSIIVHLLELLNQSKSESILFLKHDLLINLSLSFNFNFGSK